MKEFDLIDRFFKQKGHHRRDVVVGIGDDCAVMSVPPNQQLAVTTDTLVEGVHFLKDTPARSLAYKAVAVNLSDLAAMGAEPSWLSMSLSLPDTNEAWMESFAEGFYELLEYYSVQLVGGDTVRGPLSVTVTAQGFIPEGNQMLRSGAQPGDWLYVTGSLGDAGAGLALLQDGAEIKTDTEQYLVERHLNPTPRIMLGTSLRRIATSCIDVSDGLLADLRHVMNASNVGARLFIDRLPLSDQLVDHVGLDKSVELALTAGDDYELLFTVSEEQKGQLETVLSGASLQATCIGQITGQSAHLDLRLGDQPYTKPEKLGFEHF
ncbi:thiamine-phosphate kinase [Alteromonas sediminis]|uniref:Thiamine-monophosphate kinase n=1 Tax=Alteromonas sediminis TaxID=2259342 RepID=A0A3N5Z906_9ALTE|nr:thiamine-phosphate kinase [Alteromonas sediminis]RPJ65578.1 thiamine-phosphate kinase [Alteromonas sediminis]